MRPAFSSPTQATAFGALLLALVTAPWLAGKSFLPPREQAYATEGWTWGPYPWVQRQIFEETNAIDIAFVGSSHLNWGIDTPYVQQQLDIRLGRKSVVRSICWGGGGFDALYFITRDLLAHRSVKTLVFYDEGDTPNINPNAPNWFRFGEDAGALVNLPLRDQIVYYLGATLEMPRNLLEIVTPNLPEDTNAPATNFIETAFHALNPEVRLGSVSARTDFDTVLGANPFFAPYTPQTGVTPKDIKVYSPSTAASFEFANRPRPAWQLHFARQFGLLAQKYGCQLVYLHMPIMAERDDLTIKEAEYWPDFLKAKVTMMGIPTGQLYQGLTTDKLEELYADYLHLNENGQRYFTSLITPELLQLYENRTSY